MQGYLATITSAEENTFLGAKVSADAWIGASDATTEGASEGNWKWVTGPESGTTFWNNGAIGGVYNNWASGEPNNAYVYSQYEHYAHMYGSQSGKYWNDLPNSGVGVYYYLVEYGGMEEASPQLSTTVTVSVNAVNDAPTTPGAFTSPTTSQNKQGGSSLTVRWGSSYDVEGNAVKYNLSFYNGSWVQIGNLLSTYSMSYTLPEDNTGSAMFRVYATDTMDSSSARDVTFTIDSSAPEIIYGTDGNSSYANSHSSIVTGTDALAGISQMAYAWTQDPNTNSVSSWATFSNGSPLSKDSVDGDWYLHIKATDNANNINYSISEVFKLDNTEPVINIDNNGSSTYSQNHSTVVTATDATSGLQELYHAWTQDPDSSSVSSWTTFSNGSTLSKNNTDGDWYLHIKAIDNTSNVNQAVSNVFKLDNSAPAYSWISKPLNASTGDTVVLTLNVTDLSSLNIYNVSIDGDEQQMNVSSDNYSWNIDIPASDSGTLVSQIIYNCTFVDIAGNTNSTGDVLMNVSILPIADFNVNVSRGISPLAVNFTDNSSGLVENWLWDFGDGSNSTEQNITHIFTSGNYTVNLTVNNANGTSTALYNIRCAEEPEYTKSPNSSELNAAYGEEQNFTLQSTLYTSFEWFIDGNAVNGTGITLFNNTNDSEQFSYCLINSSQYINQSDFFMDIYNVSVQASNESIGRNDTHYWIWTVTNSSSDGEDIDFVINVTPTVTINGSEKYLEFNTTNNNDTDENGLACSIVGASFNTTNDTTGIEIKVEVLNVSSINQSSIDFSASSIYQYLDISFNNETLVNNASDNRSIEFRVLNEKDGGTLIISSVYLRHWSNPVWEAYTPVRTGGDGTYSYFIVRDISGFSPFAVTCSYEYPTQSDGGMPAYLKMMLFWSDEEEDVETETVDIINSETSDNSDSSGITDELVDSTELESEEILLVQEDNNKFPLFGILALLIVAGFFIFFMKKKKDASEKQL